MKKILYSILIAGLTLASAACQKVDEKSAKISGNGLKVTATIASFDGTKVNYAFTDGAKSAIKPTWSEGDKIFGFDNQGGTFTFTVTSVDTESRRATFEVNDEYAPEDGTIVYGVYYPDKTASDFDNGELDVDITSQSGILGDDTPVIMCATATVSDGAISFEFANQTAIVGIYKMQIPAAGSTVTGVAINNVCVTGTIKVADGAIALVPDTEMGRVSAEGLTLASDESGYVTVDPSAIAPYFAVIPCESTMFVEASTATDTYYNVTSIASAEIAAGNYYYIGKVLGESAAYVTPSAMPVSMVYFGSLQDAVTAANLSDQDVTIGLMKDLEIADYVTVNNANGKITTLELNGKSLSSAGSRAINVSTDLIIEDSEGTGRISAPHSAVRANGSKLTINGGTIEGDGFVSDGTGVVYSYGTGSKLTINGGTIICTESENAGRAVNVTAAGEMNGGAIICNCTTGYALRAYNAINFVVDGANAVIYTKNTEIAPVCAASSTTTIEFKNGYAYTDGGTDVINSANRVSVTGGHFNKEVTAELGYKCNDLTEEGKIEYDGKFYRYQVIEAKEAKIVETGKEYQTFALAVADAKISETAVTVKMLENATIDATDFTNNMADIVLDLDGHTLSGSADFLITTSTKLTIQGGGKISSTGNGIIRLDDTHQGDITISNTTIEYNGSDSGDYAVSIKASSTANDGIIKICDNAKIISNARGVYASYGTININDCELTTGKTKACTAFYLYTGGKVNIYEGCSVVNKSGNPIFTSGTGNSSSSLQINGGWFQGKDAGTVMTATTGTASYLSKIIINGGHFSTNIMTNAEGGLPTFLNNKDIVGVSPAATHTHGGVEYSYGFEAKEILEKVVVTIGKDEFKFIEVADAFDKANEAAMESQISLIGNCSTSEILEVTNTNLVTLDLNGKALTGRIQVGGCCEIIGNGTLKVPNNDEGFLIKVLGGASLTIENGTFQGTTASNSNKYCIWGYGESGNRATIIVNGGTISAQTEMGTFRAYYTDVTINNGTVKATGTYPRTFVSAASGYYTINGGRFEGSNAIWRCNATSGKMTINGGTFIAQHSSETYRNGIFYLSSKANTLKITGGAFWSSTGVVGTDDSGSANVTNLTVQGGKFYKNASISLPASNGYEWKAIEPADGTTIPDKSLTYEVVKAQ